MKSRSVTLALAFFFSLSLTFASAQTSSRVVGSITAISGQMLTIKPDTGPPASVTVSQSARILRAEPGAKKLSSATPIALSDLAVGDRVLALVKNGKATVVVAMKHSDIEQRQAAEAAAWKKGAGGLVKAVDAAAGTVTIRSGARTITIHTTPQTHVRRYSPNSARYADAKPSSLAEIRPGDQLRVRGQRNPDGSEITADAIVAGTFRNIAGIVLSTDPGQNTVTVMDRLSKKQIAIHIDAESQLHKLPSGMAEELAKRLKHRGAPPRRPNTEQPAEQAGSGQRSSHLSQMLESTPTVALSDLHKGDAIIIVATQGTPDSADAVTLLAGVGPILKAFPSGSQKVFSASWNLNGGGAGAAGAAAGGGGGDNN